jgi:FtsH-binding integral membrane protein
MAVVGYTTKKDLTKMGGILMMALIGLIIATIVNFFLQSDTMSYIVSGIGVLVFTGLTAYDSQKIKDMLMQCDTVNDGTQKLALLGSLTLYLDFVNLFLYLLRFLGNRK